MNCDKLTAKLSDGTEWELVGEDKIFPATERLLVEMRRVKPSPPKEVYVQIYESNRVGAAYGEDELPLVGSVMRPQLVRYILAPEPEPLPKPPAEYALNFTHDGALSSVLKFLPNGDTAKVWIGGGLAHKAIIVREVLDGKR